MHQYWRARAVTSVYLKPFACVFRNDLADERTTQNTNNDSLNLKYNCDVHVSRVLVQWNEVM